MDISLGVWIAIGVVMFLGISIATSASSYFVETIEKMEKKGKVNSRGITAFDFAKETIITNNLPIKIARTQNKLENFYSSKTKIIAISQFYSNSVSVSALAVTAHEIGHAIDDNRGSVGFKMWYVLANLTKWINRLMWLAVTVAASMYIYGATQQMDETIFGLANIVVIVSLGLFALGIFFRLLTVKIEMNASSIALRLLKERGLENKEIKQAKKLLSAALITYIGSVFMPFVKIIRAITWVLFNTVGRLFR